MKTYEILLNEERNVKLTAWIQDVEGEFDKITKRPAIVILPGGGYSMCSDREAEVVAFAYAKAGYQTFILRYSVGVHKTWPNPLDDYEQAIEMILNKQEEWHVLTDKMAVIGFSAGGHLAACAATVSKYKPSAAILGYGALGQETADMCQPGMLHPVLTVDKDTCPCFLFATRDDFIVNVQDTVDFQKVLIEKGIMFESHIYAYGLHGFSTGEPSLNNSKLCSRVPNWVQDSIEWLADILGQLTSNGMSEPVCSGRVNGDHDEFLSTRCTIAHMKNQQGQAKVLLAGVLSKVDTVIAAITGNSEGSNPILKLITIGGFMEMLGVSSEEITKLDEELRLLPNQNQDLSLKSK